MYDISIYVLIYGIYLDFFLFYIYINVCYFICICINFLQLNFKVDSDGNGVLKMNMEKKIQ